jgi:Na+-driven multidrug efflux pump
MRKKIAYNDQNGVALFKTICFYCLPVILLQWLGVLTSTFSTNFLSQYSTNALAASGLTYRAFLIVLLCLNGFQFAQGVIIAKSPNKEALIPQLTSLILILGCSLGLGLLFVPDILYAFHDSSRLVKLTIPYFHWLALACPFIAFNGLWQQIFLVYKKPYWIVAVALLYFVTAVIGNHIFILGAHGHYGFGLTGSSMAELCAQALVTILSLILIAQLPGFSIQKIWFYKPDFIHTWIRSLHLGWPIALRWMNEMLALGIVAIFIGYLGTNALGGFRVVSQLDLLVLMIPYSMNIILALLLAKPQSLDSFQKIFRMSLTITLATILLCSLIFWLCPGWLLSHFFHISPNHARLYHLSIHMLMITGIGQIFNAIRQLCNAALRALDDTFWPFLFSIISYWGIAVFGSWLLTLHEHHHMLALWWCVNATYIIACILSAVRLAFHLNKN